MRERLSVAILAAGGSRRLGQPKQLVMLNGQPLLRRQCQVALEADIGAATVILGCLASECAATIDDLPVTIRANQRWHEGLATSIHLATATAIEQRAAGLLLLHADQYRIEPDDLRTLHGAWTGSFARKACRSHADSYLGPPVIFPADCFPALMRLRGDQGAKSVLASLAADLVVNVDMPSAIHDLDLPSQLDELLQRSSAKP